MKVALIPCAATDWTQDGRLLGRVDLEPGEDAHGQCKKWSETLRDQKLARIYHAPDILSKTTAQSIAQALNIPAKNLEALAEVDLGLWAGLTEGELKKRFAKAHRQLIDSPMNVRPPNGEDFSDASARLRNCLKKQIKPNGRASIGLVMRPFSFAMACYLLQGDSVKIWEASQDQPAPRVMECFGVPEAANNDET